MAKKNVKQYPGETQIHYNEQSHQTAIEDAQKQQMMEMFNPSYKFQKETR